METYAYFSFMGELLLREEINFPQIPEIPDPENLRWEKSGNGAKATIFSCKWYNKKVGYNILPMIQHKKGLYM